MPPKFDENDPETLKLIFAFKSINLSHAKAVEAAKSPKNAASLKDLIEKNELSGKHIDEKQASLISNLAIQGSKLTDDHRKYCLDAILDGRLKSTDQVSAATKYLDGKPIPVDSTEFNKECGVAFNISPDDLFANVSGYLKANTISGWSNLSSVINKLKSSDLRWANPLDVKSAVERAFTEEFGPKGSAQVKGTDSTAPKGASKVMKEAANSIPLSPPKSVFEEGFFAKLHKPGENPQIDPRIRDAHVAVTGGEVWTRFPPEPNGFLHIGHSKSIFVNFGYAAHHNGRCYLRYDDTNPEAEEARYFVNILKTVRWLGFEPWKITYSSDYFQRLYDLAVELIKRDKAYVCHCTGEEISAMRGGEDHGPRRACAHRTRPISESLAEFEQMKEGKYRPGEVTLRMKQDLEDGNPQMWDLIAYRTLDTPHHRTGDRWKIYPTYDFTHCLVDSFENISHSLCTPEFILSRVSYEWLCDALEVYKPRQSEFGRLNVTGTITSKRKILALVKEGFVRDWDDPRLYTLIALRRRGVPPGAILSFVSSLGVTTATTNIQAIRFEQAVRQYLENTVPRLLMVVKPLKVTIENLAPDYVLMVEKPLHPKIAELGTSSVPFTRTIYIEADDFRREDSKDYFRLAPGKTVGLFQAPYPITCTSFKTDSDGNVTELVCRLETGANGIPVKKPKAFIQWIAEHPQSGSPVMIDEIRIFHPLFKSDNPAAVPDFRTDVNPDSLEIIKGAMVEVGFLPVAKRLVTAARKESEARIASVSRNDDTASPDDHHIPAPTGDQLVGNESVRFQGLRVAYFALDSDAHLDCLKVGDSEVPSRKPADRIILNRIVSLKEDAGKNV
ncbi:glutaminyl-tRNA synthetase [Rickenella mellea]|uniref:glutamine--tRNA ligase n=1 Tax=Rickenella mellea TaxID=50990 RepID=A0A4R5XGL5_9AGAM|nr:glutaminyl-tRNA synthetase [Rickenella mellea]